MTKKMESCCSNEERKQYEDRVDMSLFDHGPAVVFHWRNEEHWPVEFVSANAVLIFGYSAADFYQARIQYAAVIHPDDLERVTAEVVYFSESGAKQFQHEDYRIVAKDGTVCWVEDHTQIIRDDAGQITHYLGYVLDVSARKMADERLANAARFANVGLWDWNIVTGDLYLSDKIAPLFGYKEGELETSYDNFLKAVHPDDRALVSDAVDNCVKNGAEYNIEHRVVWPDGSVRWLHESGDVMRADDGSPLNMLGVARDITSRKDAEKQLIQAKLAAETASQAKSEFLSRMSHELRTPMNAILGFTELMMELGEDPLTENQRESLNIIQGAGRHLLDLINEVLDLAKIDAGKLQLACNDVDWRAVLKQSVELTRPSLDKQGLSLIDEIASEGPAIVKADEVRLRQVLLNLLSNAVKYNRPQGSITLRSTIADTGMLRIEVTDTGEGLTEAQIGELFEPFNRLTNGGASTEGVGIGLVISKRLMELMGGDIGVQCVPGEGCTFCLELPIVSE